jgi:hypothetical protein
MAGVTVNIHATCLRLAGAGAPFGAPSDCGVLLLGPSGSGKSDLALRLIAAGAELVADDRTDLFARRGALWASAPARLAGLIEIRNVGIVKLTHVREVHITIVAKLGRSGARLPAHRRYRPPAALGLLVKAAPPIITLAPFEISAVAKLAAATAAYALGLHREDVNPI